MQKIVPEQRRLRDKSAWPVRLALLALAGCLLGIAFTYLDTEDPRWYANAWSCSLLILVFTGIGAWVFRSLRNRMVQPGIQLSVVLCLIVHLLLLIVSLETHIFGRFWDELSRSAQLPDASEQVIEPDYHDFQMDSQDRRQQSFEQPVEITAPDPVVEQLNRAAQPQAQPAADPELPSPAERISADNRLASRRPAATEDPDFSQQSSQHARTLSAETPEVSRSPTARRIEEPEEEVSPPVAGVNRSPRRSAEASPASSTAAEPADTKRSSRGRVPSRASREPAPRIESPEPFALRRTPGAPSDVARTPVDRPESSPEPAAAALEPQSATPLARQAAEQPAEQSADSRAVVPAATEASRPQRAGRPAVERSVRHGGAPSVVEVETSGAGQVHRNVRDGPPPAPVDVAALGGESGSDSEQGQGEAAAPEATHWGRSSVVKAEPSDSSSADASVSRGPGEARSAHRAERNFSGRRGAAGGEPQALSEASGRVDRRDVTSRGIRLEGPPSTPTGERADSEAESSGPARAFRQRGSRLADESTPPAGGLAPQTEEAIESGLAFLARYQRPDGSWSLQLFDEEVALKSDTAATALAVLAFQGGGYTHQEHQYAEVVDAAIDHLVSHQKQDGDLYAPMGDGSNQAVWLYSHGIAALALSEAYGMTQDPQLRPAAQKAIDFIVASQDSKVGGWRYSPGTSSDTSVTGWMMMALKSAELAGLEVPETTYQRMRRWIDLAQASDAKPHLFRYNPLAPDTPSQRHGRRPSKTMTSVGLLMLMYDGVSRDGSLMQEGAKYLLEHPPAVGTPSQRQRDTYYWYYAAQVMYHMGGEFWEPWNEHLYPLLIDSQVEEGDLAGSWDPGGAVPDRWGAQAGRLYVTAMNLLSLEVHYRHLPVYEKVVDPEH